MNYVKKMCILRQIKQGFSSDGKTLSGLVKAEQYGKNLAVEVSIINFAPLVSGEYYCLLTDGLHPAELLPLRGKSIFNVLTDADISGGFCAVICFVKNDVVPIAYGINGNREYDWKNILNATLPPSNRVSKQELPSPAITQAEDNDQEKNSDYNDEELANENYFTEQEDEQSVLSKTSEDAPSQSAVENENAQTGINPSKDGDAESVLRAFTTESDGYYRSVKTEIDALMEKYPRDERLKGAFSCSEWVRVKGEENAPEYLVGVVYNEGKAKYICYAFATDNPETPPEEIAAVCTFVPLSPYQKNQGFFIIFQSAATGECIQPNRL
jgi:hypothetical protein